MSHCKLNKISGICEQWKIKDIETYQALKKIEEIVRPRESEMPPCNCNEHEEVVSSCSPMSAKTGSCHSPGPATVNPFFNFMKELRETTCFNKTVPEVAQEASRQWQKMSESQKTPYIVQAYNVSRKKGDSSLKRERSEGSRYGCGPPNKISRKM